MGAKNLGRRQNATRFLRPISKQSGVIAASAYFATLATFGLVGWPLLSGFF